MLIGPNNAGKTAIIDALRIILTRRWGQRGTGFTDLDVHRPDHSANPKTCGPVTIEVTAEESRAGEWSEAVVDDLSDVAQIDPSTETQSVTLRASCLWSDETQAYEPTWDFLNLAGEPWGAGRRRAINTHPFFRYFPSFYLGALRDASEEFTTRSQFWRKLLDAMHVPPELESELAQQLADLNTALLKADPRLRHIADTLERISLVAATDDAIAVDLQILPMNSKEVLEKTDIIARTHGNAPWLPLMRHGQGVQSLSLILLFRAYVEHVLQRDYHKESSPTLLLEEPEAHLHPQAARGLWSEIDRLPGQVILATHSPYIAQRATFRDVQVIRLGQTGTEASRLQETWSADLPWVDGLGPLLRPPSAVAGEWRHGMRHSGAGGKLFVRGEMTESAYRKLVTAYANHENQTTIVETIKNLRSETSRYVPDDELKALDTFARRIRGEILFARRWIMVEGQTEYLLMHATADAMGKSLDHRGVAVIDYQRDGSIGALVALARAYGIPWKAIADNDPKGNEFRETLAKRGFSELELVANFKQWPSGDLEDELASGSAAPMLRKALTAIGVKADQLDATTLAAAARQRKVSYAHLIVSELSTSPGNAVLMPDTFAWAIGG